MGNGASASPMAALGDAASALVHDADYEGKGTVGSTAVGAAAAEASPSSPTSSSLKAGTDADATGTATDAASSPTGPAQGHPDETALKVYEVANLVRRLQKVRVDIAEQSRQMSESKVLEKLTTDAHEVEKREVGVVHVSRDRSKSMEEYHDGTTIRRIDGSIERKRADGTIEQISATNEVTMRSPAGDITVLAEHDTLLNQKHADGTQIQTNLESKVQIVVHPDGRRVETDANTKTVVTLDPDGTQVTVFEDKTTLTLYTDGRSFQVSPNGTTVAVAVDGTKEQKNPDGSSVIVYPDGRKVRSLQDGTKIESFPDGVSRQLDNLANPEFGARTRFGDGGPQSGARESKESKSDRGSSSSSSSAKGLERADTAKADGGLPALAAASAGGSSGRQGTDTSFSPGGSSDGGRKKHRHSQRKQKSPKSGTEDEEDEDGDEAYDLTNTNNVKVTMSMGSLVGALAAGVGAGRGGDGNGELRLQDLTAVQVIRLLREWSFDVFRKDFAQQNVTGKMLHDLDSVSDPLLSSAPSSVRKELYHRLQKAKKHGLSRPTQERVAVSPVSKLRQAVKKMNFSNNALDKSKMMWGNDFDSENIRAWVGKGAFIDWHNPDERGCTIVHMVAKAGKLQALQALVELKADLNAINNRKTTPLHLACRKGHLEVVRLLIESKADATIRNKKGSALDEARAESKSAKIANLRANIISVFGHLDR